MKSKYSNHIPSDLKDLPENLAEILHDQELFLYGEKEHGYVLQTDSDPSVGLHGLELYTWYQGKGQKEAGYDKHLKNLDAFIAPEDIAYVRQDIEDLIQGLNKYLSSKAEADVEEDDDVEEEEEIVKVDAKDHDAVIALAEDLLRNVEIYEDYSGRGMYGEKSPLAFTSSTRPNSQEGYKFIKASGMSVDNLGMDYIYYYKH